MSRYISKKDKFLNERLSELSIMFPNGKYNDKYGLFVSDDGRVFSKNGELKCWLNGNYYIVSVKGRSTLLHQFVYMTFNGEYDKRKYKIIHKNLNLKDNSIYNLELVSKSKQTQNIGKTYNIQKYVDKSITLSDIELMLKNDNIRYLKEYDRYVTRDGTILRYSKNGGYRKCVINKTPYGYLRIGINGTTIFVHRLIAIAYIPNPFGVTDVDHINGNTTDNRIENLRWLSHKDNMNNCKSNRKSRMNLPYVVHIDNNFDEKMRNCTKEKIMNNNKN